MKMSSQESITVLQYLALINQVSYVSVCRAVGITPQQFSDWVKKRRPVPKERLQSLAEYFEIEADLLIDEKNNLQELTQEKKIDIQILFLNQKLDKGENEFEMEEYREKLVLLQTEKEKYILISRFDAIISPNKEQTRRICEAFLDQMENGNYVLLEQLLNPKEENT
ncbi:helix-turn-helix domain-containing protein [Cytobacillus praedii]|uniref:Transcriptional regulator n=1 Tax=Cytobacillus praedii TaxID=1742358 RepID=A0A4R1AQ70_9BACI|nr:helix-turn-helix domain-containing protein [Cytobacillus praedii]TCJ02107.1 transcriptional regulator [Cytobacillus praedii]